MDGAGGRRRMVVSGRVQGVGFRRFVERVAREHRLAGWVRNRQDGAVELEVEGSGAELDRFRQAVRQGPPGARVDSLEDRGATGDTPLPMPFTIHRA